MTSSSETGKSGKSLRRKEEKEGDVLLDKKGAVSHITVIGWKRAVQEDITTPLLSGKGEGGKEDDERKKKLGTLP